MPANSSALSLEIGSTLAHFELLEVLGEGGMGIVFRAQDTIVRRQVALKVMQPHLAKQTKSKERFLREARTAGSIEHDRIVRIYEVKEDRGIPYIAMELLKGQSLDKKLMESPHLPLSFIFRVIRQVAEGLAVAHEKRLIHRDIKPSNIWLEPYEGSFRCKILDFGLARAAEGDSISTKSGQMMGTPSYMSPEQWKGKEVDSRTDLYSLGIILYQMTTGKTPFESDSHANLMYQVLMEEAKSPLELNPQLPSSLCDLIKQLMAKEKENRPKQAQSIVTSLERISKQVTDLARDLTGLPQEAIFVAETRSVRQSDTYRPKKQHDRSDEPQTIPISSNRAGRWLPWLGMFIGLLVGITGIVLATQKQTAPDRTAELAQLLTDKSQLEERLKQLEKELSGIGKKTPEEMQKERQRLAEYDLLVKEKQKLEGNLTQLEAKLLEEQKAKNTQKSEFEKIVETQKGDIVKLQTEKQTTEAQLKEMDAKVLEYQRTITKLDTQTKLTQKKITRFEQGKDQLESEIASLKGKVSLLEKEKNELANQIPKKPTLLDCTERKGANEKRVKTNQRDWANYLRLQLVETIDLGGGVKMEFVLIPPGKFIMGATKEEQEEYVKTLHKDGQRPDFLETELPPHEITITKPFYLGKYEVTQQEYVTLTKLANPSEFQDGKADVVKGKNTKRYPVEMVSWTEAKSFLELLSKRSLPSKVKTISFPTEAQWEYACRAGTRTPFHFGESLNGKEANCLGTIPFATATKGPSLERPHDVGQYQANAFGLFDMHGNVWEWCLDGFDAKAYERDKPTDPFVDHSDDRRILRGGSWHETAGFCRAPFRNWSPSEIRGSSFGFRVVLLLED
jgi:serine/threonine protein kinase/formylglycine-generating enzyme required for sulfatase activity